VEFGRAYLRAGWPEDLIVDTLPGLWAHWPRCGDETHEQRLNRLRDKATTDFEFFLPD
jgi:hypothetical protein